MIMNGWVCVKSNVCIFQRMKDIEKWWNFIESEKSTINLLLYKIVVFEIVVLAVCLKQHTET